jgi:hypothetical protein
MLMLTEGLDWPERQLKVVGGGVRAAGTGGARGEVDAGHLRASDPHRSGRGALAEVLRGLRRSGKHRRRGIEVAERLTGGGTWRNSGRCTGRVVGEKLGKLPGAEVELMRDLAGAGVWRSNRSTAEQEVRCGGARRPAVLGVPGGYSAAVGHREGLRRGLKGPTKGEAGDLGVRALVGIAAVIRTWELDLATARRDPGSGKEASGRRTRTGDWPVGSCSSAGWSGATSNDGTAGRNRGSRRGEEEGKKGEGVDRRARTVRGRKGERGWCGAGLSA